MKKIILNFNEFQFGCFKVSAGEYLPWTKLDSPQRDHNHNEIPCHIRIEVEAETMDALFWAGVLLGREIKEQEINKPLIITPDNPRMIAPAL